VIKLRRLQLVSIEQPLGSLVSARLLNYRKNNYGLDVFCIQPIINCSDLSFSG
jgi:hypothetical protein